MRLKDKVALITGAAAGIEGELMGFGGAAAWQFVREGACVVVGDIDDARGEKSVAQMCDAGFRARFAHLDVTCATDWDAAIEVVTSAFGNLNVLVNNAGIDDQFNLENTPSAFWDAQMNVNAKGPFLGMQHAIPPMRAGGGGSIINISSINGIIGSPGTASYDAAKGAIRVLTKSAAVQLGRDNIRVNSIHPGYAWTPMTEAAFSNPRSYDARVARVPLGRMATAADIANGIVYLASDESSYITGAELVIDGGVTAQ